MFSDKKPEPEKQRSRDLSQSDISNDFAPNQGTGNDDNDSDSEAKLAGITPATDGGRNPEPKPVILTADLDRMVADSLKDISDEELSGDDEDPALLSELQEITGESLESPTKISPEEDKEPEQIFLPTTIMNVIDIIRQRIERYKIAEENANTTGEAGKARRFNRGLKTLHDLLKEANSGKKVNVDDIPPEVVVKKPIQTPNGEEVDMSDIP